MNEDLQEIIKIAWAAAPANTEYYLSRYIAQLTTEKNKVIDEINYAEDHGVDIENQDIYDNLVQKEKLISKKINRLGRLISFLRGS